MSSHPEQPIVGVDNLEKLQTLRLAGPEREELLAVQSECTLVFSNSAAEGWPSGVVVSFVWARGSYWITAAGDRRHVQSLAADPRVSLVISNAGTSLAGRQMLSVRGTAIVHSDAATRDWFLPQLVKKVGASDPDAFLRLLTSPNRVVLEIRPTAVAVSHDSRKLPGDGRGGPAKPQPDRETTVSEPELVSRVANLYYRYARAVDEGDVEAMNSLIADDVQVMRAADTFSGRAEVLGLYRAHRDQQGQLSQHFISNVQARRTADSLVHAEAYFQVSMFDADGRVRLLVGEYSDVLRDFGPELQIVTKHVIVKREVHLVGTVAPFAGVTVSTLEIS